MDSEEAEAAERLYALGDESKRYKMPMKVARKGEEDYIEKEGLEIESKGIIKLQKEVSQTYKSQVWDSAGRLVSYEVPDPPRQPRADPRDTHLEEFTTKETRHYVKLLVNKRESMKKTKYMFLDGKEMRNILVHVFHAKEYDFKELEHVCDNMNHDPHLPFRKSSMYRLGYDLKLGTARRLERAPFLLTEKEGFVRKDTGVHRFFGEAQDWIMQNSAFQALLQFKAFIMLGIETTPRPGCDVERNWNQCGFLLRTITTPKILGDPAAEGVHQDGVDFTMTTLFKARNIDWEADSAKSSLLTLNQKIGSTREEIDPKNVIETVQHRNYLDTLIFVDNEISHSVTPCYRKEKDRVAHRDMAVIFTRRMAKKGGEFCAEPFDTETGHPTLPFAMGLKSKHLAKYYPKERIRAVLPPDQDQRL